MRRTPFVGVPLRQSWSAPPPAIVSAPARGLGLGQAPEDAAPAIPPPAKRSRSLLEAPRRRGRVLADACEN